jgi:hypothetical protein
MQIKIIKVPLMQQSNHKLPTAAHASESGVMGG